MIENNLKKTEDLEQDEEIYPVRVYREDEKLIIGIPKGLEKAKKAFQKTVGSKFINSQQMLLAKATGIFKDEFDKNAALQILFEMGPKNPTESMLAAQIISLNDIIFNKINLISNVSLNPEATLDEMNNLKTLTGIFQKNVSTLYKLQHGGKQNIRVQHVNVSDGGQAIIGDVKNEKK